MTSTHKLMAFANVLRDDKKGYREEPIAHAGGIVVRAPGCTALTINVDEQGIVTIRGGDRLTIWPNASNAISVECHDAIDAQRRTGAASREWTVDETTKIPSDEVFGMSAGRVNVFRHNGFRYRVDRDEGGRPSA